MPKRNTYEVFPIELDEINRLGKFEILLLAIPEEDIDDKLTYLTRDKGKITRSFFEDFLLANCVANINQLLAHINRNVSQTPDIMLVRKELVEHIIEINPILNPNKLVINKNFVVKRKGRKIKSDETVLTDNPHWSLSYYEDPNKAQQQDDKKKELKEKVDFKSKDLNELTFETTQAWWRRIGQYVKIKKFSEEDADNILKRRYFHSSTSFNTFIVSVCVVDFEDLFALLDNMGIPSRVAPPILMNELYELCKSVNPFLTYDNAQKMADEGVPPPPGEGEIEGKASPYRMASVGPMSSYGKKVKKKFKDVPKEDLLSLADNMKVHLIGQDTAVEGLAEAIQRASVGLKDPNKPIGSFLFAGRTGVGKTLASKVLADELIKSRDNLYTIDCSEYSADHEYSKLIGAPAGYIGHEQGGYLTNAVTSNPFCVIVFDEVEKASSKVHELMLQILEEGRLTDGKGQTVSFKDTVIIMTSNVGASEVEAITKTIGFGDVKRITDEKKDTALKDALKKKFKPEFLNRIDDIINFKTLKKEDYMRIIDIELYKLNDNLRHNDTEYKTLTIEYGESIKEYVYKNGIDENFGARPLKRCIEKEISTPLAKKILSEGINGTKVISVVIEEDQVAFSFREADASLYVSEEYQQVMQNGQVAIEK